MKRREHDTMEHILQRMAADRSVDAPADLIKYAQNLFKARVTEPAPSVLERVLAVLSLDLAPNKAAFGERSSSTAHARQMLFESGDHAIDLRIAGHGENFDIKGQILGDGFEGGTVRIAGGTTNLKVVIDELGGFSFPGLPAGEYSLSAQGVQTEILIEKLILS